jgi:hypothetical protein
MRVIFMYHFTTAHGLNDSPLLLIGTMSALIIGGDLFDFDPALADIRKPQSKPDLTTLLIAVAISCVGSG